jgi:hypothetical protein
MTTLHPGGVRGDLFQLYGPWSASYTDFLGSIHDLQSRFSMFLTCGVSQSQSCRVNSLSVVARALTKWSLKDWMARSVALTRWLWGSSRRRLHLFLVRFFFGELLDCPSQLI